MASKESDERERIRVWEPTRTELVISSMGGILFVAEIAITFLLYRNFYNLDICFYSGWLLLFVGIIMMSLPRYELSKKGRIPKGQSWVNTTVLVDTGLYGVVRHPLYVGWLMSILAMMLISQHWITILTGIFPFLVVVYYAYAEDQSNAEKFGNPFIEYKKRVPMMNFLLGLVRYRRRRKS